MTVEDEYVEIRGISREPLGKLAVQGWLAWPETDAVVAALTKDGAEVRFVGGCVRDAVIAGFYSLPWTFAAEERKKLGLD